MGAVNKTGPKFIFCNSDFIPHKSEFFLGGKSDIRSYNSDTFFTNLTLDLTIQTLFSQI